MDQWTEIRRKVLVEGASKRSIHRDYDDGHAKLPIGGHRFSPRTAT